MPTEPKTEDEVWRDQWDVGLSSAEKILRRAIRKDIDHLLTTDMRGCGAEDAR